jgi:transcriptional regulator with XRE-family HTH domain
VIASELARLVGRSDATISRLLDGKRRPSVELMWLIKQQLDWSMDEQSESIRNGTYGWDLEQRMARQPTE